MTGVPGQFAYSRPPVWVGTWSAFEVKMKVFGTARIEGCIAGRADGIAGRILVDRKLCTARTAKDRQLVEFILRPDGRGVARQFGMAFEARIKAATALELDRDDVERRIPMGASCFGIDVDAVDLHTMDKPDHLLLVESIR